MRSASPTAPGGRSPALPGGGSVVAGERQRGPLEFRAQLLWLDAAGAVVDERSPEDAGNVGFTTVAVLADGSALAGGVRHGQGWLAADSFERVIPQAAGVVAVAACADGGFALAARRDPSTTAFGFALLAVHAAGGGERWSQTLPADRARGAGGAGGAWPTAGIVAVGHWERDPQSPARLWLVRLGAGGERIWERLLGDDDAPRRAAAAVVLPGGDLAVAGHAERGGVRHTLVTRVAGDGTTVWERTFADHHEVPSALAATPDGGLVLAGLRIGGDGGRTSAVVRRLDDDGRELWARTRRWPERGRARRLTLPPGVRGSRALTFGAGGPVEQHGSETYFVLGEGCSARATATQRLSRCRQGGRPTPPFRFSRMGPRGLNRQLGEPLRTKLAVKMTAGGGGTSRVPRVHLPRPVPRPRPHLRPHEGDAGTAVSPRPAAGPLPSLDLDSLYGAGPQDSESARFFAADGIHFKLGKTVAADGIPAKDGFDLPRGAGKTAAEQRHAIIPDPRNDENLAVAQTHLALMRFHNRVADSLPASVPAPSGSRRRASS